MKIKQADNRKQRSCMSILSETFRDFAENTSIHGLKYTVRSDTNPYEKMFWLLIVLSGVCGAIYMTILFWERYTSNPTRTTILTTFAPTVIIPFPAVTVCNINRIMVDKVDSFVDELHLKGDEAELAKRALPQLLAFTHPTFTKFNVTELQTLQAILENNEITDINYIMKRITQSCPEMLVKCVWSYKEEECMELFRETLTVNGHCCSFNYIEKFESEMVHTPYHGPSSGLYLILDTMTQSVQHTPLYSKGMQVMLHSPQDYPGDGAIFKMVAKGRQTDLQILGTQLKCSPGVWSLPVEQRQCVSPEEVEPLFFHEKYADTNCLTECDAKYFIEACNCVPFYFYFSGINVCNMKQINCLNNATKETVRLKFELATTKDIENTIKAWLRGAIDRNGGRKNREEKNQ